MAGSIPDSTIEEIKSRIDLVDLISSYGVQVRRAGSSYKACCPFHHEKTPSFNIQPDRGFYHCFGCGESGDAIKFVQKQDGLTFMEALKKLAARCGVTVEEKEDPQAGLRKRLYAIHAELAAFYHRCLNEAKEAQRAREYLKNRSLDGDVAESFQLGYAPVSSAAMLKWAAKYKFKPEDLTAAGVLLPPRYEGGNWYNRFAGRLVFPIRDKMGRTLAFSCRTLETDKTKMRGGKYVNSSDSVIFKKSDVIYALDKASPRILAAPRREAIVCEGQVDVIRCHSCGFDTAVAGLGTSFTKEHVQLLKKSADSVVLVFDADGAGVKATLRTGAEFLAVDMPVRVATLPEGEDPDSFLLTQGPKAFQARLDAAESITSFMIRVKKASEPNPTSIAAVTRMSRAVLEMVAICPSAVMQASLLSEAAQLLGLPVSALEADLATYVDAKSRVKSLSAARSPESVQPPAAEVNANVPVSQPAPQAIETAATSVAKENDAAAPINNPPPPRELALCGFLFKHENDREIADLVASCAPPELFAHGFTRGFVQAWLKGCGGDAATDEFAAFCRNLAPEESRWFDRISADERDSLCEKSPVQQLQAFLKLLWSDAVERRIGMLDSASTDDADRCRLECSMLARRFQRGAWQRVRPLMTPENITG